MQRRTLLRLGLLGTTVLAVAGAGVALWVPGWRDGRFSEPARALMADVARVVLQGALPADPAVQQQAVASHLARLETAVAGLPPATRAELADLLALLSTSAGRLALSGLANWHADPAALHAALQEMRVSSSQTRQQVYHALRDLTNAAWFADAGTWGLLGYPGPTPV